MGPGWISPENKENPVVAEIHGCRHQTRHHEEVSIMTQGVLPYKVEQEKSPGGMTALGGLPAYLDLARVFKLAGSVAEHVKARTSGQGWLDAEIVLSLVLLQLAGGECVDDLRILEGDDGFCRILRAVQAELLDPPRSERRRQQVRWRKERRRPVPSPSSVFRFLEAFKMDESAREEGKAWIPEAPRPLLGLRRVNRDLVAGINARDPQKMATLDVDATLKNVCKEGALHCYKGPKAYQPLNVYWDELGLVLHSEFRDGNVPAGHQIDRVLIEALDHLPDTVEHVRVRSDSAAYQWDFMFYMAKGTHPRLGVIEFSISSDVTPAFREAVGLVELPFPTMDFKLGQYKLHSIITNRLEMPANELILWHWARCGKSEEAHSIMKEDLAGGHMPSGEIGQNAAWWAIMLLAYNLNAGMKRLVLGSKWETMRLKALRFRFICLPARVIVHARQFIIRLAEGCAAFDVFRKARETMLMFAGAS